MDNILSNIGDTFLIYLDFPITHIDEILGFEDDVELSSSSVEIKKEFRYTTDLLNWSDWVELSDTSLQEIEIVPEWDFDIQYRYTKLNKTGTATICWVKLKTNTVDSDNILDDTLFNVLDQDDYNNYRKWCANVLRKIYEPGIIPKYIERGDGVTDRDYIDFWRAIICYFGILVIYARRFESLEKIDIVRKILDSRQIFYRRDSTLEELVALVLTSTTVLEERGRTYDEIQSLMNIKDKCGDIFILSESVPGTSGIFLDTNSVIERYVHNQPETHQLSVENPDFFTNCVIVDNIVDTTASSTIITNKFKVNPLLNYELVFLMKGTGTVSASISSFDSSDLQSDLLYLDQSISPNPPIDGVQPVRNDKWYLVRVIVYGNESGGEEKPNILVGSNLRMEDSTCTLQVNMSFTGKLQIKDLFFKIVHTDYSKSFIQNSQLIDAWFRNKSTERYPLDLIHEYLLNYDKTVLVNELSEGGYYQSSGVIDGIFIP